jgi:outer membrane protein TolC
MRKRVLALLALAGLAMAAWADGGLSLEQAQAEALGHSPRGLKAAAAADEQDWRFSEAQSGFWPRVTLDASHFNEDKFQGLGVTLPLPPHPISFDMPMVYPYTSLGFTGSWTLFEGFSNLYRSAAALAGRQAGRISADWATVQVAQDVRLKYCQALTAQQLEGLAEANVKTLEDHLRMVQDLLNNGQATKFDVLRVEVQLDEARTELLAAQDRVVMARRSLTQAMGLTSDARPLSGELPVPQDVSLDAAAADDSPALKARDLQAQAAGKAAMASLGHWAPRLMLVANYQWYNNQDIEIEDFDAYKTAYQLGFAASWELFNGFGSLAHQQQAFAQARQAEQDAREARLKQDYDREFWGRRLRYCVKLYQAKLADVDKAQESVRLATLGQKAGTRTTTEVLDAELDSFRSSAGVVSAQMDAAEALINLELALGKGE